MEKVKIAMLGYGTVGRGIQQILNINQEILKSRAGKEIELAKILVRESRKQEPDKKNNPLFVTTLKEILEDPEIMIVIEVMGGEEPATEYMLQSLKAGKHVVTANKLAIAVRGREMIALAREKGLKFLCEASVGGGIPIIRQLKESLNANEILSIMGIVNGTTNYILSKMTQEGKSYEEALKEAQEKGFAESDPTSDVGGYDAVYKLAILSSLAFSGTIDYREIYREGIEKISSEDICYADRFGYVVKLLAIAKKEGEFISARVHPAMIAKDHPMASINDSYNGIFVTGNAVEDIMISGRGAGAFPTSSAVLSDVLSIVKTNSFTPKDKKEIPPLRLLPMEENSLYYYIHLKVDDTYGVLSAISAIFGQNQVSILAMNQEAAKDGEATLVFITHLTKEKGLQEAMEEVGQLKSVRKISNVIRIEALIDEK